MRASVPHRRDSLVALVIFFFVVGTLGSGSPGTDAFLGGVHHPWLS